MDPSAYKNFTKFKVPLPPFIPVEGQPAEEGQAEQASNQSDWTVLGPDIARDNFSTVTFMNTDTRMTYGGRGATNNKSQASPSPWMSRSQQQPFMSSADNLYQDSEATPRASDQQSQIPYPSLSLPQPSLALDFRLSCKLNPRISVGPTPFGHRNWISFAGGSWAGSWGSGIVLPGGQDNQLIIADGSAHLETNYILQTHDDPPAHIVIKTHGWRTGPAEVLEQLADPTYADNVDPNSYKFRLFIDMETGDERYRNIVNCGMWVGSGMRKGAEVIYDAYRVS